jgi:putative DNA primase/helicase
MALVSLLAFWTGGDRARIDQLFRQSGLYREKWDADRGASTYGENTIGEVLNGLTETYDPTAAADGGTAASVPAPEQLIAEIEAGERSYGDDVNTRDPPGGAERWCSPAALVTNANLDVEDGASLSEAISELTDRQAAAHVWELMKQSDEFHVCVRCEAGGEADDELRSYDSDAGVWTPDGERALRHAARQALTSIDYSQNVLTELKAQVRGDPEAEVGADTFGVNTGEIAVANGLLDLDAAADGAGDDALRPLRPDDYALACLPVEYDPGADSERWEAFVEEVAEDSEAADAL